METPFVLGKLKFPLNPKDRLLVLAALVFFASTLVALTLSFQEKTKITPITPIIPQPLILSLESPAEGAIATQEQITVRGQTLPAATVVFYTETDVNSLESDANGHFEGTINLTTGINSLTVTAFAANGEEKTLVLDLVFDESVLGVKTESTQSPGQAKKEASPPPQATLGNVKQVTPNKITVEEKKSKKQTEAVVDKNTKIIGRDKKILKLEKVKPQDLVAIISTESGKKVVKIFVRQATDSAQAKQMKRRAIQGVITNITGGTITLAHQIQRERVYTLLVDAQTVIKIKGVEEATLADLAVGQRIAAVGDLNEEGKLIAKRIHVIPGKATGIFEKQPVATPSATITPTSTPSATPTTTVEPTPTPTLEPTATPTETPTPTP